jgi:hypothetical protein
MTRGARTAADPGCRVEDRLLTSVRGCVMVECGGREGLGGVTLRSRLGLHGAGVGRSGGGSESPVLARTKME